MPVYVKKAPERRAADSTAIENTVREMLRRVREEGDAVVREYSMALDQWERETFRIFEM